jgi:hypothetical protein
MYLKEGVFGTSVVTTKLQVRASFADFQSNLSPRFPGASAFIPAFVDSLAGSCCHMSATDAGRDGQVLNPK